MNAIAERFTRETADHRMTVLHDQGLYRHLQFRAPDQGTYWFDLITVPGSLIFQGDGESFVFSRIEDMFEFFRGPLGRINPGYWSEKVTTDRGSLKRYDQDLLVEHVNTEVRDAVAADKDGKLAGLTTAVAVDLLDELTGDQSLDRSTVERFQFYTNNSDRYTLKPPDFCFQDSWEWDCEDYDWWFLWALHGIVWGIHQYDTAPEVTP